MVFCIIPEATELTNHELAKWALFGDPSFKAPSLPIYQEILNRIELAIYMAKIRDLRRPSEVA